MTFDSLFFIIFFLITLVAYYSASNWAVRKGVLLVASYFFYGIWNPPYVLLLLLSTIFTWTIGNKLIRSSNIHERKVLVMLGLIGSLGAVSYTHLTLPTKA